MIELSILVARPCQRPRHKRNSTFGLEEKTDCVIVTRKKKDGRILLYVFGPHENLKEAQLGAMDAIYATSLHLKENGSLPKRDASADQDTRGREASTYMNSKGGWNGSWNYGWKGGWKGGWKRSWKGGWKGGYYRHKHWRHRSHSRSRSSSRHSHRSRRSHSRHSRRSSSRGSRCWEPMCYSAEPSLWKDSVLQTRQFFQCSSFVCELAICLRVFPHRQPLFCKFSDSL